MAARPRSREICDLPWPSGIHHILTNNSNIGWGRGEGGERERENGWKEENGVMGVGGGGWGGGGEKDGLDVSTQFGHALKAFSPLRNEC